MLPSPLISLSKEHVLPDYAVFILRFCLFAIVHSLSATGWMKRLLAGSSTQEPRAYRMIYNVASIAMFIWVMGAYHNSQVLYFVLGVWSLIMYLFQLCLLCILFNCVRRTGIAAFLGINRINTGVSPAPFLVTNGWYAVVRHPLYLFSILFLILNPVMTAQWLLLTILATIYFVTGALIEERRLVDLFGDEYRHYRRKVPFMLPRPGRLKQPPSP